MLDLCFNSQDVMLNTGKLLFAAAEKHGGKVVGDDFTRTCFTNLAQRLGVCAHMRYYQQTKKSDVGGKFSGEAHYSIINGTTHGDGRW